MKNATEPENPDEARVIEACAMLVRRCCFAGSEVWEKNYVQDGEIRSTVWLEVQAPPGRFVRSAVGLAMVREHLNREGIKRAS